MRLKVAYRNNYRCQICSKLNKKNFNIHHLTYNNLGNEKYEDLLFLCQDCHLDLHKTINNNKINSKKEKKHNKQEFLIKQKEYRKKFKELNVQIQYLVKNKDTDKDKLNELKKKRDKLIKILF